VVKSEVKIGVLKGSRVQFTPPFELFRRGDFDSDCPIDTPQSTGNYY